MVCLVLGNLRAAWQHRLMGICCLSSVARPFHQNVNKGKSSIEFLLPTDECSNGRSKRRTEKCGARRGGKANSDLGEIQIDEGLLAGNEIL